MALEMPNPISKKPEEIPQKFEKSIKNLEIIDQPGAITETGLDDWSLWSMFYGWLSVLCCVLFCVPFMVIPQHDVLEYPKYWYELMIPVTCGLMVFWAFLTTLRFHVFFKDIGMQVSVKMWLIIFLSFTVPYNITYCLCKMIWTDFLGYNHPLPFIGIIPCVVKTPFVMATLWYLFPIELRRVVMMKKRIFAFLMYTMMFYMACIIRNALIVGMLVIPTQYQPCMAVVIRMLREFDSWYLVKLGKKATYENNRDAEILTVIEYNCNYSAFLAIALGQLATPMTVYAILFIEFIFKIYHVINIVKFTRKIDAGSAEKEKLDTKREYTLQNLIVVELVGIVVPIAYILAVLMAYYGPNGVIIGNISNSYWSYTAITDIWKLLSGIGLMLVVDCVTIIFGSFLLWKVSSVNCIKVGCKILKNYLPHISITLTGAVVKVRFYNSKRLIHSSLFDSDGKFFIQHKIIIF